ncbi:DNA repair protein RecO [Weissella sagaensis]|uniref:DNA repair protein RecO n=1 Tax=Weissella sagaensis TaxID=2559928 RepID=UPI00123C4E8D|nr:DNA repair protein RecO [Weissella sagaensis]KAA8431793.1 DNA repair protein RecO [Weissella paramesenteroides]KAA8437893.1 DNA repair protein RecO [Weissella paramesenteroides]
MTEIFDAIVMYQRDHKEKDLMVKMLTRQAGKRMFYVRYGKSKRYQFAAEMQPLSMATFEGVINTSGLSFINDVKETQPTSFLMTDIVLNAYMTYIIGLIDAAFVDNQPLVKWYDLVAEAMQKLQKGLDPQGIANYFELQLLPIFGIQPTWGECVVCGRRDLPLDFSEKLNGTLCQQHWEVDPYRMHIDSRAVRILSKLAEIDLHLLGSLDLQDKTKQEMARLMDKLYDDQVGIHLRAKSFIQQLASWQNRMITRKPESNGDKS